MIKKPQCECGGIPETIGQQQFSQVQHCPDCHACELDIDTGDLRGSIPLRHFYQVRLEDPDSRSPDEIGEAARHLFKSLILDLWPEEVVCEAYGIRTTEELGTLQLFTKLGITDAEFDRLLGEGDALTMLAASLPHQPYGEVRFRTVLDHLLRDRDQDHEQALNHDIEH